MENVMDFTSYPLPSPKVSTPNLTRPLIQREPIAIISETGESNTKRKPSHKGHKGARHGSDTRIRYSIGRWLNEEPHEEPFPLFSKS